ncbi:hypothetical protein GCM10020001_005680 [Nonomuraea salmonea]
MVAPSWSAAASNTAPSRTATASTIPAPPHRAAGTAPPPHHIQPRPDGGGHRLIHQPHPTPTASGTGGQAATFGVAGQAVAGEAAGEAAGQLAGRSPGGPAGPAAGRGRHPRNSTPGDGTPGDGTPGDGLDHRGVHGTAVTLGRRQRHTDEHLFKGLVGRSGVVQRLAYQPETCGRVSHHPMTYRTYRNGGVLGRDAEHVRRTVGDRGPARHTRTRRPKIQRHEPPPETHTAPPLGRRRTGNDLITAMTNGSLL